MAAIYDPRSKPQKKSDPELEKLGKLLDEYEISIFRIEETLNSKGKKHQKLELLTYELEGAFNSIKKTPFYIHAQNRLDVEKSLKDISYETSLKSSSLYLEGTIFKVFAGSLIGAFTGLIICMYSSSYPPYPYNQIIPPPDLPNLLGFLTGVGLMTSPIVFPSYYFLKKRRIFHNYEKKMVKNCEELIKKSKPFIASLRT